MGKVKKVLERVPFKNHLGQTIEPGDQVVQVTTAWGGVTVQPAIYLGLMDECVKTVSFHQRKTWVHKETGNEWHFGGSPAAIGLKYPPYPNYDRNGTYEELMRKRREASEQYSAEVMEYNTKVQEYKEANYEEVVFHYTKKHTLQRNRVYKSNFNALEGKTYE